MKQKIPVIKYEKDFTYTEITLYFPGGSSLEDDKTLGFAHFCEHLAFKLKADGESIFEFVSALGGSSNAYTSNDVIAFEISVQSKFANKVLAFLEQVFSTDFMTIEDCDFNEERRVVLEEMAMYNDSPSDNLNEALMHNLYSSHIYGQKILGERETIENATKEDIAEFWKNRVFNSPYLVIAGGIDGTPSMELEVTPLRNKGVLTSWEGKKRFETAHGQNKCYFTAGWKLPPQNGRLDAIMNLIIAITYGMDSGVIYNELVYENNIFDSYAEAVEGGVLASSYIQLCVMPASNIKRRLERWAKAWNSLTFTQSQVAKAREVLLSREFFNSEGLGNTPGIMGKSYLLFKDAEKLDKDYFYEFIRITAGDLNNFKKEFLGFDKVVIGFAKPPKCTFDINTFELPEEKSAGEKRDCTIVRNGGTKCFVRRFDSSPFVTGCILKKGGSVMNLDGLPGSLNLAVSSLFASAAGMTFDETDSFLDKFGIKIKTITRNSYAGMEFKVRDSFTEEAVDIVKKFFDNEIKEEDFEKERQNSLSTLSMMQESPEYFIKIAALKELFGGTPWEYLSEGTFESVKNMTLDDVRKTKEIFMKEGTFTIALAGAADTKTAESLAGFLKNTGKVPANPVRCRKPLSGETVKIPVKGKDQVYVAKVFRGPAHFDRDFDTMKLLESYMNAERSPLFTELREKNGLVYAFTFGGTNSPAGGAEMFLAITSPEKVGAVQHIFDNALEDIKSGRIIEERLNETKNTLATYYSKILQRSSFHAENMAIEEVLGIKAGRYLRQLEIVDAITPEMIVASANKWLGKGTWILAGAV